jgi:hypothetical protein
VLASSSLDVVRARELDDALDALEHLVDAPAYRASTAELVKVRDALETQSSRPAEAARSEWIDVAGRLRAHLGVRVDPEALAEELRASEEKLTAMAKEAIARAKLGREALVARTARVVFPPGECVDAIPGSRIRSMAAPPERAAGCHLRHLVAAADDDAERAVALAAMHDHVVVAEWALEVARGERRLADAERRHPLLSLADPEAEARLERIAQARPIVALGAGEVVRILLAAGEEPWTRARRWNAFGDVPLDIAARELGLRPRD